jgi:hypothetical protein
MARLFGMTHAGRGLRRCGFATAMSSFPPGEAFRRDSQLGVARLMRAYY